LEVQTVASPADVNPFTPENAPVKLIARARRLPQWTLAWNGVAAADPPASPVQSAEPEERVTLVPFGAEDLRVTDFPVLGDPTPPPPKQQPMKFTFDNGDTAGWTWIGGGWWTHEGQLRTSPTGGAPGFKAMLENVACADLTLDAAVTPPPTGDAGVIFRVSKPSIGPDAYQGYYAGVSASSNQVILGRADGRTWTPIKIVPHPIRAGVGTKLSITARGNRIEVRLEGEPTPAISVTDDTWHAGGVGVRMYTTDNDHAVAAFDNVTVAPR
jgi:hypothetical protein